MLPRLSIDLPERPGWIEPQRLFERPIRDAWLEIGFGNGEHLAELASCQPEIGFIGCEPFMNGVASLLSRIERCRLSNIRIFPDDARLLLPFLPTARLGGCCLLFPDPWPKARHHRRRFLQADVLDTLARILADGAELRLASDDAALVDWMLWLGQTHPSFDWTARSPGDWRGRPEDWPPTRYERKALKGPPIFLRFRRRPRSSAP